VFPCILFLSPFLSACKTFPLQTASVGDKHANRYLLNRSIAYPSAENIDD
jgi:hypothetical protein